MAKIRNPRREVVASFTPLIQRWEGQGMPMLGSMFRILRWAYEHGMEGSLESLMDTWLVGAERLNSQTLGRAYLGTRATGPDTLPRTKATVERHRPKHDLLQGLVVPRKKTAAAIIKRRKLMVKKRKRHG
jgi:hypothetical protein